MTILFYIIGYIVLSIAVAYFLKTIKIKAKKREEKINSYSKAKQVANNIYDRKKHNDYMNDPRFSYMSCNKYNPESSFYKENKISRARREKRYILVEESKYNRLVKSEDSSSFELNKMMLAQGGFLTPDSYKYCGYNNN
jgi:hypothetical protein